MSVSHLFKAEPVSQADRIRSLDCLRGVALLGILLMNIPVFALPEHFTDAFHQNIHHQNFWVHAIITILFEGKMRALFSMIFGAGILLFIVRKEQAGLAFKSLFFKRMIWLVIFGLIHAHLMLWTGDILYFYGLIGILAFFFRHMQPRHLAMGVPIVAIAGFVLSTLFYQSIRQKRLDYIKVETRLKQGYALKAVQRKTVTSWMDVQKEFIPDRQQIAAHTLLMKSGYKAVAGYIRPVTWDAQTKYFLFALGDILALMLLGMALYHWGFFSGDWSARQYRQTMVTGYGIGLPLVIYSYYQSYLRAPGSEAFIHYMENHPVIWTEIIYPFQRILLVMAHASLLMLMIRSPLWISFTKRLAAVGQMAFTNYILQTLFCTFIFFGYGLNCFAEIEFYELYYIAGLIWVFQLIISPIWLRYFLFGPLEWLWRSLTYWELQPMRRPPPVYVLLD